MGMTGRNGHLSLYGVIRTKTFSVVVECDKRHVLFNSCYRHACILNLS